MSDENTPPISGRPCQRAPHDCLQAHGNEAIQREFRVFWDIWETSIPALDEDLMEWRAYIGEKPLL